VAIFCRIESFDRIAPCIITFGGGDKSNDYTVFMSLKHRMPDKEKNMGQAHKPTRVIMTQKGIFNPFYHKEN
jgi:hypothetical protein